MAKQRTQIGRKNLHVILGGDLMQEYEEKCTEVGLSKSEAGRIMVESFVEGDLVIVKAKAIPATETETETD